MIEKLSNFAHLYTIPKDVWKTIENIKNFVKIELNNEERNYRR